MGFFKRLAALLGLGRDDDQQRHGDAAAVPSATAPSVPAAIAAEGPSNYVPQKGFSVPVQVPVGRAPIPPLLVFCPAGDGGLQGLRWYTRRLKIDEDGDIADEFLDELSPDTSTSMEEQDNAPLPKFKVKYNGRPANVRNLALSPNGKIQHLIEYKGKLEWV